MARLAPHHGIHGEQEIADCVQRQIGGVAEQAIDPARVHAHPLRDRFLRQPLLLLEIQKERQNLIVDVITEELAATGSLKGGRGLRDRSRRVFGRHRDRGGRVARDSH